MRLALAFLLLALALPASAQRNLPTATVSTLDGLMLRIPVTTPTNEVVSVLGYHAEGDWGAPRTAKYELASSASTNSGCVFAATTTGRWVFEDCLAGPLNVRWFGGTNDATAQALALAFALSREATVSDLNQSLWLTEGPGPAPVPGTMALYSTNVSGAHELAITHGSGAIDFVATKAWVGGGGGGGGSGSPDLIFGTNTWRQQIVALVTSGGFELPVIEWSKVTGVSAPSYYDLIFLGDTWRTYISAVVFSGGIEMPVLETRKL